MHVYVFAAVRLQLSVSEGVTLPHGLCVGHWKHEVSPQIGDGKAKLAQRGHVHAHAPNDTL